LTPTPTTVQVHNILNGVLAQLERNPARRFNWAEISFFRLWWRDLADDRRDAMKRLVQTGQFEFIGGGWVQHDEVTDDAN